MPTYAEMIIDCLAATDNKKGTTKQAIVKFLKEKYSAENVTSMKTALKKSVETEKVVQISGTGFNGSFKLKKDKKNGGGNAGKVASAKKVVSVKKVPSTKPKKIAVKKNTVGKAKLATKIKK